MTYLLLLLTALAVFLWLGNGIRKIGAVSQGNHIEPRPNAALLMIDLQSVFWNSGLYDGDLAKAQSVILAEAAEAKANEMPIIAMRQEWSIPSTRLVARLTMCSQAIAGTPGTEMAKPFADLPDHVLVKRVQDSFETGELDTLLGRLNVGTLRIVGLDAKYCVTQTVKAARNRGYSVEVMTDAILSADQSKRLEMLEKLAGGSVILK